MAQVLQITDLTTTLDLLTAGNVKLAEDGWDTQSSSRQDRVWETLELIGSTTEANIRTFDVSFHKLMEQAEKYDANPLENNPVWFYWQSEGESAKRALLFEGTVEIHTWMNQGPLLGGDFVRINIAILRSKVYEATSVTTDTEAAVNVIGGTWIIGNDAGAHPQRISELQITPNTLGKAKFWVGIRDIRNGTAGFIPVWEAENGTNFTDAADAADATARGGNKVTVSFATDETMVKRIQISWNDIQTSANWDDIIGSYLVLARLKLDATTTEVAVQFNHGWSGLGAVSSRVGTTFLSGVDNNDLTSWNFIEMGYVDVPPTGNRDGIASTNDEVKNYSVALYAERISAGGSLDVDCFVLIPSEHLVTAKGTVNVPAAGLLHFFTGPDDGQYALGKTASGGIFGNVDESFESWHYPLGGGILVIAAQATTASQNLTDDADIEINLYPRWKSFRT